MKKDLSSLMLHETDVEVDKLVNKVDQSWLDPAVMKQAIKRMISHQIDILQDYLLDCQADASINAYDREDEERAYRLQKQYEEALVSLNE